MEYYWTWLTTNTVVLLLKEIMSKTNITQMMQLYIN